MKNYLLLLAITPAIAFSQPRDTCIKQQWKIEVGKNTYAVKDTQICFNYTPGTGGTVIKDTIFITNNILYKGEKGDKGDPGIGLPGPAGPQGIPGICPTCPPSGGGGSVVVRDPNAVYVDDYGAIPNDNKDDLAAFNAARDASIAAGHRTVILGNGEYTLKGLWNSTQGVGNFARIIIRGQGRADGGAVNEKFTLIRCQNTSGPCITANAFRLADMSDFVLEGNQREKVMSIVERPDTSHWRPETWLVPGNSIDKYEHQSGIALDYGQTNPPWAAQGIFQRLKISGFVVGISISPSAGNMQADTYWFRDIKMEGNIYHISVGQDQARSITFENVWMNGGYCGYINNRFGRGNGSAFNIHGGQYTSLFKLLETTNAYRGQMSVNGIFMEACGIIGSINGLGVNTNAAVFTGCEIGLDDDGWFNPRPGVWITPFATMSVGGNIVFTGCNIHSKKKTLGFSGNQYIFNGTTFTETTPIFPNDWATVSITGRPLFEWQRQITDQAEVSPNIKKYVRYGVSSIRYRGQQKPPYTSVRNASVNVPYWGPGVWLELPNTTAKQFEWPIPTNDTRWYRAGDYLDCQAKTGLISGMGTDFGQAMIPGLEVVEVKAASLVLRRIAPEMRVESWYRSGQVYAEPYIWTTGNEIRTEADGETVPVVGGNLLSPGDYVYVMPTMPVTAGVLTVPVLDWQSPPPAILARVVAVNGNNVTFNVPVVAGTVVCVSY